MLRILFPFFAIFFSLCCNAQSNFAQLVNPFIGTGGHGHTYPGATLPHGMVQLSPDTRLTGWDGCSGYHYSDSFIYGFSHTHLSGTGVSDYGDILLMPMQGNPSPLNTVYGSRFSHSTEKASPGYYAVLLEDDSIATEFTCTERVGFHHYTFNKPGENTVILDLAHRDEIIENSINIEDEYTITGLRRSKAWAQDQYVFFVIKSNKPIRNYGLYRNDSLLAKSIKQLESNTGLKAYLQFDLGDTTDLLIKVAISPVSIEGAKKNLKAELPGWDFQLCKANAEKKWNTELAKLEVKGNEEKKKIFYTALYHTSIVPNIYMDVDGQYRGMDKKIHTAKGFTYYSVFSLWDTYRAAHPLYTIIDPQRDLDYIKTMLAQYEQGGRLPVWELAGNETECMIGYHSIPVIADAYAKGIIGFDTTLALEAMQYSAMLNHFGLEHYKEKGFIQSNEEQESVSRTLEYAFDDWNIAMMAKGMGKQEVYNKYIGRAQNYKNLFNPENQFIQPKKNGGWLSPFDPKEVNNNYTEANGWQYNFSMPQDISNYASLLGGNKKLEEKLDELFTQSTSTTGRQQSDITGLIGQYAHGNEPSHHIAYLYNYAGAPQKTQEKLFTIMNEFYKNDPDGLIGNEDCGQMSAWYVMTAMGFYPTVPGKAVYDIGRPFFEEVKINLPTGKQFIIKAKNAGEKKYVKEIKLKVASKNNSLRTLQLNHEDILAGGTIKFDLIEKKEKAGKFLTSVSKIIDNNFVTVPAINSSATTFRDSTTITMNTINNARIYYSVGGEDLENDHKVFALYKTPFTLTKNETITAYAVDGLGNKSVYVTAEIHKIPNNYTVKYNNPYETMYSGGGEEALIDGITGDENWRRGNWQGYQSVDVDLVIDLKETKDVHTVKIRFLQDTRAWIVLPKQVIISTSMDGINFTPAIDYKQPIAAEALEPKVYVHNMVFPIREARYIKLQAVQYGKMPDWHEGAGGDTHIFVDEITVN